MYVFLVASMLFCNAKAQPGFDMDDEDFAAFVAAHDYARDVAAEYSDEAARGCVKGGVTALVSGKGIPALCIGCVAGAVGEVVTEITLPRGKK